VPSEPPPPPAHGLAALLGGVAREMVPIRTPNRRRGADADEEARQLQSARDALRDDHQQQPGGVQQGGDDQHRPGP